jgi:hypothetical protein
MSSNAVSRFLAAAWRHIGFVFIGLSLIYCAYRAFDPPRLNYGDTSSDYNIMYSGRNFAKYGFVALKFTPHLMDPATMVLPRDSVYIYTHYPQLPDLMNGVERRLGLSTLTQFRFVALLFSFASLFFIYQLAVTYWGRQVGQVAIALWVTNPMFVQHADYLHHLPYAAFFGFGSLYLLSRYLREGERPWWLAGSSAMVFLTIFASYDMWFCLPLLLAALTMWHYRAVVSFPVARVLGILAAVTFGAVLLKFASNAWALGGWNHVLADFRFQVAERASDRIVRTGYRKQIWNVLSGRIDRFFTPLLFVVALFWVVAPRFRRALASYGIVIRGMANPIVLLVASVPFLAIFIELWFAQYYPTFHIIPFYAIGSATIAVLLVDAPRRWMKIAGVGFVAVLLANSLDEDLTFPIAFFPEAEIQSLARDLNTVSPPQTEVLVNNVFDATYRYYFNRRTMTTTLIPPKEAEVTFRWLGDYRKEPNRATPEGAIFVRHKHVADELYDKGYYYIASRYRYWTQYASPRRYHASLDSLVAITDSIIAAGADRAGVKLYDNEYYTIWRILPPAR